MLALVGGELRSLQRERSTVVLAAAMLFVLTLISILASHGDLRIYLFFAYVLVPLFTTATAAVLMSTDRQTGYAAVLHTAPVTPAAYFAAKFVAALAFGLLAVALTTPLLLLLALHAGTGMLGAVAPYLAAGALLAVFGAALGLLISCAVGRRGLLPSAFAGLAAAFGLALAPVFLMFLPPSLAEWGARLARLSPIIAIYEGGPPHPRDWATAAGQQGFLLIAYFAVVLAAIGFVVYTRLQNPDGWDTPRRNAIAAGIVALALMAAPLAVLDPPPAQPARPGFGAPFENPMGGLDIGFEALDGTAPLLRIGEPTLLRVRVGPGASPESGPLTSAQLRLESAQEAALSFEPAEIALGTLTAVPCGAQPTPDCGRFAAREAEVTVTLVQSYALHAEGIGIAAVLTTDQGTMAAFTHLQTAATGYAEWQSFAVAAATLALVAAPHFVRGATLGRRPEPTSAISERVPDAAPASFTRVR
jgi:ABC-type transport system involved in multi-copper enzyme maturation permease subunit